MLDFIRDSEGKPLVIPTKMDYAAAYGDLVAAGDYRHPDPIFGRDDGIRGVGRRVLFYRILEVRAEGRIASETVFDSIAERNVRPVTIFELLTVGAAHPHLPNTTSGAVLHELAAFGSVTKFGGKDSRCYVPVIQRYNGRRYLDPHRFDFPWKRGDQFLVAPRDGGA